MQTEETEQKDPAALLYIDKWIAATQGMAGSEKGWFLDLILFQFDKGPLPNDIDELAGICRIRPSEFDEFKLTFEQKLKPKFELNGVGKLENKFAKSVIKGRKSFKEKRSMLGRWGYVKKFVVKNFGQRSAEEYEIIQRNFDFTIDIKDEQKLKQMLELIFELYINANANTDLKKKKESIERQVFSDLAYVEELQSIHRDKDLKQAFNECYIHHSNGPNPPIELWQWRQKLNSWLSSKRPEKPKVNGYQKGKFVA